MGTARLAVAFIAVAACGAPPRPPPAPPPVTPVAPRDVLSAAALLADVAWLTDERRAGRGVGAGTAATARWLEAELVAAGLEVRSQPLPSPAGERNVIAIWPGRGAAADAVVVVAHYDHLGVVDGRLYPGADDNASGVAVALAAARELGRRRHLARPIVFLFAAAEEIGLHGAHAYAAEPVWPLERTRAVVNLDMVGRRFFELAVDRDAAVGAVGLGDDPALAAAAERAAAAVGVALVRASPALLLAIGQAYRGDDWALRREGLPALHLSTGLHDDYHRPTDTTARLVPAQLERVARLVSAILAELDDEIAGSRSR
jgi:hypothetical protein